MASELTFLMERKEHWDIIRFDGHINDQAQLHFQDLLSRVGSHCLLNLRGVQSFNSSGLKAWLQFIVPLTQGREVYLEECSPPIIAYLNLIPNFLAGAKVHSVYGNFVCGHCRHQQIKLFELARNMPKGPSYELDPVACAKCGKKMDFEDYPEDYFSWVERIS
jgi:hypothetical protein